MSLEPFRNANIVSIDRSSQLECLEGMGLIVYIRSIYFNIQNILTLYTFSEFYSNTWAIGNLSAKGKS